MSGIALDDLVSGYKKNLIINTRSLRTLESYEWAYRDFLAYLSRYDIQTTADLAVEYVEGWQHTLADRQLKPRSRSLAATAVRGLLRWGSLHTDSISPTLCQSVVRIKIPDPMANPLAEGDVQRIVDYFASASNPNVSGLRDYALFVALYSTGIRVSEMLQLTRKDADRSSSMVVQKGARKRRVHLHPTVQLAIARYVQARTDDDPWLWVTFRRGLPPTRLRPEAVRAIFKRIARRVGVEPFTTHQLRHTAATLLYDEHVPEGQIADYLGHNSIDATRGYIDSRNRSRELMPVIGNILARQLAPTPAGPDLARLALELDAVARLAGVEEPVGLTDDVRGKARELAAALRQMSDSPSAVS